MLFRVFLVVTFVQIGLSQKFEVIEATGEQVFPDGIKIPAQIAPVESQTNEGPMVQIQQGSLLGKFNTSRAGRRYAEFLGIPYASAPKRFQAPEGPIKWSGLRDAVEEPEKCLQFNLMDLAIEGTEDCLFANVHTPNLVEGGTISKRLHPVIVFIHPGSFYMGSGSDYKAKYLMDEDVVLVTFNYRLGPLGFLSTGDDVVSGNAGLKDQAALLLWVQENIEAFGGDRRRVTVVGQGSGAASVSYLIASPMGAGLFQNAIAQSGNAFCSWAIQKDPLENAKTLASSLDCTGESSEEIATCLENIDARMLVALVPKFFKWFMDPIAPFAPVIESASSNRSFITEDPRKIMSEGRMNKVHFINGMTSEEGAAQGEAILSNEELTKEINDEWARIAPITLSLNEPDADALEKIRFFYFGGESVSRLTQEGLTELYTDRNYGICTREFAIANGKFSPTFLYAFNFKGNYSSLSTFGSEDLSSVANSDDLQYLFDSPKYPEIEIGSNSDSFSRRLVRLWVSFAESGIPYKTWNTRWTKLGSEGPVKWYELNQQTSFLDEPLKESVDFWENIEGEGLEGSNFIRKNRQSSGGYENSAKPSSYGSSSSSSGSLRSTSSGSSSGSSSSSGAKTTYRTTARTTQRPKPSSARTTSRPNVLQNIIQGLRIPSISGTRGGSSSSSSGNESLFSRIFKRIRSFGEFLAGLVQRLISTITSLFGGGRSSSGGGGLLSTITGLFGGGGSSR